MILKQNLKKDCIAIIDESCDKNQALLKIAELANKHPILNNKKVNDIYERLVKRENIASTGFNNGIAIPHCSFDDIEDFIIGILIHKTGIDFNAADGKMTKLFFFVIGPTKQRNKHIQILSSISRFLQKQENVDKLLNKEAESEVYQAIYSSADKNEEQIIPEAKTIFHVFIQKEELFNDILQIFAELVNGSISVIETFNAGHYLHSLPIFSTFWSEDVKISCKVIIAVVNKNLSNNIIRRINTLVPNIESESGVLITANEIFYSNGSIDF